MAKRLRDEGCKLDDLSFIPIDRILSFENDTKIIFSLNFTSKKLYNLFQVPTHPWNGSKKYVFSLSDSNRISSERVIPYVKNLRIKYDVTKKNFIRHFPNCEILDISENDELSYSILSCCKKSQIKQLDISKNKYFPGKFLKFSPKLETIFLDQYYDKITPANFKVLTNLKHFRMGMPFDDMEEGTTCNPKVKARVLTYTPNIEKLTLVYCWYMFQKIPTILEKLEELRLDRSDIADYSFIKFPNLRVLEIECDKFDFKAQMQNSDGCLEHVPRLEKLRIQNTHFQDMGFRHLTSLKSVDVFLNQYLTDRFLLVILSTSCRLTLTKVNLRDLTDKYLDHLIRFPNLKVVKLSLGPATWNNSNVMTCKCFDYFPKMKNLEVLSCDGYGVTEVMDKSCVKKLLTVPKLKKFRVSKTILGGKYIEGMELARFEIFIDYYTNKVPEPKTKEGIEETLKKKKSFSYF